MSPKFGGPHVALTDLTRWLTAQGVDTTLVTTNSDPAGRLDVPLGMPLEQRGARVIYFDLASRGRYAFSPALGRYLLQETAHFDLVHIHWLYNYSSLIAAFAARRAQVPYLFQSNGSLDPNLMKKNRQIKELYNAVLGNYILKNARGLIFTTDVERQLAGLNHSRVPSHIVPVGLDWNAFEALPPRGQFRNQYPEIGDKQMLLFLGRLSRQKGLDLLIPAFHAVRAQHPNTHLVLVGPDGEGYSAQIRQWIAELNLQDHVTLVGYLANEMKLAAYVDSDLYVLPSYAENFGATVTEALACAKPIVISNQVNLWTKIQAAHAGQVVECNVASVAEGIHQMLADDKRAKQMGLNGRELVRQKFTWDVVIHDLIQIYRGLKSA